MIELNDLQFGIVALLLGLSLLVLYVVINERRYRAKMKNNRVPPLAPETLKENRMNQIDYCVNTWTSDGDDGNDLVNGDGMTFEQWLKQYGAAEWGLVDVDTKIVSGTDGRAKVRTCVFTRRVGNDE